MEIKRGVNRGLELISKQQLAQIWKPTILVFMTSLIVIFGVYLMSLIAEVPPGFMTEDPSQTANLPWYTGFLSHMDAMLWCVTMGCVFLGAILLFNHRREFRFLIATGALTTWLAVDDLFLMHDGFLRYQLRIPEKIIFLTYGLIIVIYGLYFFRDITADISFVILLGSLLFLGTSMIMDSVVPSSSIWTFIEDSVKFIGIALWSTFNFLMVVRMTKKSLKWEQQV